MATTTAIHELASGAVESGSARLLHAVLVFALLTAGISGGSSAWTVFGSLPAMSAPHAFPVPVVLAILVVGAFGLMGVLEVRLRDAAWVVAAVLLAWGLEQLTKLAIPERGAPLVASFVLAIVAYLGTKRFRRSPALMLVPGLLQLTPGFVGTNAMLSLLGDQGSRSDTSVSVILIAAQLTLGLVLAEVMLRPRALVSR
jgi:uncharacterized membrane protein YjjB (DUF3815 family)